MTSNTTVRTTDDRKNLQIIKSQLDNAQKKADSTGQLLAEARSIMLSYSRNIVNVQYTNFCEMVFEASKSAEYLTEQLRRLSLEVTLDTQKYEKYKSDLVRIHGIVVTYQHEILEVTLPALVPHRKESYTDYLYKPLYTACRHWCVKQSEEGKAIPVFEKCTICFIHLYDKRLPLNRVRDHDNFEEKHVLDVMANFFLETDNGINVDTYHMTRMEERDGTVILIMDTSRFCEWLSDFQL